MIDLDLLIPDARPSTLPDRAPRCLEEDLLPPAPQWVCEEWKIAGIGQRRAAEVQAIPDRDMRRLTDRYMAGQATARQLASEWQVGARVLLDEMARRYGLTARDIKLAQERRHAHCVKRLRAR
jgi:hypothetical protein